MYGSWLGVIMAGAGVILFVVAAATFWAPLFALAISAAIGTVLLVLAAMRRTAEGVPGSTTHRGDPERHAAPAAGEGSSGAGGNGAGPGEAEQAPETESAGIWGERG